MIYYNAKKYNNDTSLKKSLISVSRLREKAEGVSKVSCLKTVKDKFYATPSI